jgi:hypothetical protein
MGAEDDDPSKPAKTLMKHSLWAGLAFLAIILIAVVLDLFARLLLQLNFIEQDGTLAKIIHAGALALAAMDVLFLIGVFAKTGWRFLREL